MPLLYDIFKGAAKRSYKKGQILLYQGERSSMLSCILDGYVKVYDVSPRGTEKLLTILGPKNVYPFVYSMERKAVQSSFYEAYTDIETCSIPYKDYKAKLKTNQKLLMTALDDSVRSVKELLQRTETIHTASSKHRIGYVLSFLAHTHAKSIGKKQFKLKLPITHQAIADMAGVTRETASLQLKKLEKAKIFTMKGNFMVVDCEKLTESNSKY